MTMTTTIPYPTNVWDTPIPTALTFTPTSSNKYNSATITTIILKVPTLGHKHNFLWLGDNSIDTTPPIITTTTTTTIIIINKQVHRTFL